MSHLRTGVLAILLALLVTGCVSEGEGRPIDYKPNGAPPGFPGPSGERGN